MYPRTASQGTFKAILIDPTEKKIEVINAPKTRLKELLHAERLRHTEVFVGVGGNPYRATGLGRFLVLSGDTECDLPSVINDQYEPLFYGRVLLCLDDGSGCWVDLDLNDIGIIYANIERLTPDKHHSPHGYPMLVRTKKYEIL